MFGKTVEKERTLVLFDAGGVLFSLDFSRFYEAASSLSGRRISPDQFMRLYARLEHDRLKGTISTAQYLVRLRELISPVKKVDDAGLVTLFSSVFKGQNDEIVDLKKKLHDTGYSVGIVTNGSDLDRAIVPRLFPEVYNAYGGPLVFSDEERAVKPDPKIYLPILMQGFGKVVYLEDRVDYLEKCMDMGWQGIWVYRYIDYSEAIRPPQKELHLGFWPAGSLNEIVNALDYFGVRMG